MTDLEGIGCFTILLCSTHRYLRGRQLSVVLSIHYNRSWVSYQLGRCPPIWDVCGMIEHFAIYKIAGRRWVRWTRKYCTDVLFSESSS